MRSKKGKEAETIFHILTGVQQLSTTLITSRFSLDLHRYRTGGESSAKDDAHLWGNYIGKKRKLLHLTAKYVRTQCVLYLCVPNCLFS